MELRRHTDNEGDRLTPQGLADAEMVGRDRLHPPYAAFVSTGVARATQMLEILRHAAGQDDTPITPAPGLRSSVEDRWRDASRTAGKGADLAAIRAVDPDLVEREYIAQTLCEGGAAAGELFALLYATASADQALADVGVIRTDSDPLWRALQQLVLIVGPLLLRPLVEQELGGSLFEPGNFERWMRANAGLLKHGLYTPPAPSTPAAAAP